MDNIGFLEVYEWMMFCLILLQYFPVSNEITYLITSLSVIFKPTLLGYEEQ
jgi:hypothetical protein